MFHHHQSLLESGSFRAATLNARLFDLLQEGREWCAAFTRWLIPDHLHFLPSSCQEGVSVVQFAGRCKGRATNESWKLGWEGKLWQPRHFDHFVRRDEDLGAIILFVMQNPVRRGLVERGEDWPWGVR